jgi:chaperonin GroEL
MLPKQITFLDKNTDLLIDAVNEFCGPVISTLGPGGCTVIITDPDSQLPHVTKDGVTVAESIFFKDPRKQAIAALIKESARKTANAVGDGTTTSVVLAKAMILDGMDKLRSVKSKKEFFDGFDLAFEKIVDYLTESSIPITKDSELLESVVKISANGDEKVCKTIMSAVKAAGADGLVNVELHDELTTIVDIKGGSSLESTTFTLQGKRWEATDDIRLILISGALTRVYEIKDLVIKLSSRSSTPTPTIIVAKEFSDEVVTTFMVNNRSRITDVALVEAEGFARESRADLLEDLAAIFDIPIYSLDGSTGAPLSDYVAMPCEELSRAIIKGNETILFRANETLTHEAESRYKALKTEYTEMKTSSEVIDSGLLRHLQRRMAKYNVVATIKVGASTKAEAAESKDRIDDALSAITAAVNGGITQGGGMALARASYAATNSDTSDLSIEGAIGYYLVLSCCLDPMITLAANSGIVLEDINLEDKPDVVYNFRTGELVNWLDGGIIDPTLVPISALTNASSVAKTILKSNSIISEWQDMQGE